jgi:hypothetical protein
MPNDNPLRSYALLKCVLRMSIWRPPLIVVRGRFVVAWNSESGSLPVEKRGEVAQEGEPKWAANNRLHPESGNAARRLRSLHTLGNAAARLRLGLVTGVANFLTPKEKSSIKRLR